MEDYSQPDHHKHVLTHTTASGPLPPLGAVNGSAPSFIEVQNAVRVLTRIMKPDDELIFTGGDIVVFRDHLYRTQEIPAILLNKTDRPRGNL